MLGYDAPEDSGMKYSSYMLDKVKNSHFIKQITNIKTSNLVQNFFEGGGVFTLCLKRNK